MNLQWFRKHQKHFLAFLAVFLMVAWGMGGALSSLAGRRWAGRAFGKKVSMARMEVMGVRWDRSQLRARQRITKADLWQSFILLHEAEHLDLEVSDAEVEIAIKSNPRFMGKNGFGMRQYQGFLRQQGLDEQAYETTVRELLLINKLESLVISGAKVSTDEAWQQYARRQNRVKVRYARLVAADVLPTITVTPKEVKAFYEAHKADFPDPAHGKPGYKCGEQAQIDYLIARKADFLKPDDVTEKAIETYYNEHKEDFKIKEEPKKDDKQDAKDTDKKDGDAKTEKKEEKPEPKYRPLAEVSDEIRKKLADEEAENRLVSLMNKLSRKIDDGLESADFSLASLAKQLPDKALGYVRTGFLGADEIGILPTRLNFEKDITDRDDYTTPSSIQDCPEGKLIYQVMSIKPTQVLPFEEVKKQVETDLRKDKALKKVLVLSDAVREKAKTLGDCLELLRTELGAQGAGLTVCESKFFTRPMEYQGMKLAFDTGLPGNHPKFAEEAQRLAAGRVGLVVEEGADPICYLMTLAGRKSADREAFEKDKARLLARCTQEKAGIVWSAWLEELNKRADLERLAF